jgi:hypothetical protein
MALGLAALLAVFYGIFRLIAWSHWRAVRRQRPR